MINRTYNKLWYKDNKKHKLLYQVKYNKDRYSTNEQYRISKNIRNHIYNWLHGGKSKVAEMYVGMDITKYKYYIESLFDVGMSWDNYGFHGWHIDHIIPVTSFDMTKESDKLKCFNYSNTRPLWWRKNLSQR